MLDMAIWTPKGYRVEQATSKQYRQSVIVHFQELVRETGYHVCQLEDVQHAKDEEWSRSVHLYQKAVDALRRFAGVKQAAKFIESTYQPKVFIHS